MPRATRGALVEGDASIITFVEWLDLQQPEGDRIVLSPVSSTAVFIRADREDYVREEVRRYVSSMSTLRNKTDIDDEDDGLGESSEAAPAAETKAARRPRGEAKGKSAGKGKRASRGRRVAAAAAAEEDEASPASDGDDEDSVIYADEDDEEY